MKQRHEDFVLGSIVYLASDQGRQNPGIIIDNTVTNHNGSPNVLVQWLSKNKCKWDFLVFEHYHHTHLVKFN